MLLCASLMLARVEFVFNASQIASRGKETLLQQRRPVSSHAGLATLHTDAVAFEADADEGGVGLQSCGDRLTRESKLIQQHQPV